MNVDDLARVLVRAHDLGARDYVLDVLREIEQIDRQPIPRWTVEPLQATYLLTRSTDQGIDPSVRDLFTTAATTIALNWRASVYLNAQLRAEANDNDVTTTE